MMVLLGASSSGWTSTEYVRPFRGASTFSARVSCDSRNGLMLIYHPTPSDVCEPSPSKGVELRGGVSPSAEL
jgi:hypothetical protein